MSDMEDAMTTQTSQHTYIVLAARAEAIREFEVEATCPDEARLMVERDLAGEWEWDRLEVQE